MRSFFYELVEDTADGNCSVYPCSLHPWSEKDVARKLATIYKLLKGEPLFTSLHTLVLDFSSISFTEASLFFSYRLQSLYICPCNTLLDTREVGRREQQLLSPRQLWDMCADLLVRRAPGMRELHVASSIYNLGTFIGLVTSLKQLVDVDVSMGAKGGMDQARRCLAALSGLDGLRRCVFHAYSLKCITTSELGEFKHLQSLNISTGNSVTGHILQALQSPYLRSVVIYQPIRLLEGAEWRRWLEILAHKFDQSLQKINLGRNHQNNYYLPSSYSLFRIIQPTTHLRYLKRIYIEPGPWWYLTDDDIATLAGSWPRLESFLLELPDRGIHRSVRSFEQFAAQCPMLKFLGLSVGFGAGMEPVEVQATSHSLEMLTTRLYWSKTGPEHPEKVAKIVKRIFPRLNLAYTQNDKDFLGLRFLPGKTSPK